MKPDLGPYRNQSASIVVWLVFKIPSSNPSRHISIYQVLGRMLEWGKQMGQDNL